jgi:hypothetical protein
MFRVNLIPTAVRGVVGRITHWGRVDRLAQRERDWRAGYAAGIQDEQARQRSARAAVVRQYPRFTAGVVLAGWWCA